LGATAGETTVDPSRLRKRCDGCGTVNDTEFRFCYNCGLALPDRVFVASQLVGDPAGFWIRAVAFLIDGVLVVISGTLMTMLLTGADAGEALTGSAEAGIIGSILSEAVAAAYYTVAVGRWGRTLGKLVVGLRVVRSDGSSLTYLRAFARYWAYYLSFIPLGLGVIAIALSPQKRAWHDLVADTRVLKEVNR
jgi:uncharacterized RDD family membrane protein YckC